MKKLIALVSLFSITLTSAQIGMGEWRLHIPSNNAVAIAGDKQNVHVMYDNALLSYDVNANEVTRRDKIDYLSEIELSTIGFDTESQQLFIGYETGNIDVLKGERTTNLPYILNANITGDKSIYSIEAHENIVYLATGFGIVLINPSNLEVIDTYYPSSGNQAIVDIDFHHDSIFALTSDKLYRGALNNNFLADPSQWVVDQRLADYSAEGAYTHITTFIDEQYVIYRHENYEEDTIFQLSTGDVFLDQREINQISITDNRMAVCMEGGTVIYDETLNILDNIYQYVNQVYPSSRGAMFINNQFYIADNNSGFVRASNAFYSEILGFDGPYNKLAVALDWGDGKLAVAGGQLDGKNPAFRRHGAYTFEEEQWINFNPGNQALMDASGYWDIISVAVDPYNSDRVAFGTYSQLPLLLTEDGVNITDTFTPSNSYLEFSSLGNGWSYVSDMAFDNDGVLWVLNSLSAKPLKAYTPDGQWYEFQLPSSVSNKYTGDLVIDYNGVKWFSVTGTGVVAFDEGKDLEDPSDDEYKILGTSENNGDLNSDQISAMVVDFDNELWVGSPNGLRILYATSGVFDADPGDYNFQNLVKQFEENAEEILKNVYITDIAVDGANRKWIGTENSGVFLFSENGLEVIREFNTANSPLVSDAILDITIDQNTGEVFIATDNGLVSYRSDATFGDSEYENVVVFPNPVRPEYEGMITIQGIAFNSEVRITDVAGNLVYSTSSNGGTATWNGKTMEGQRAATGVYLIWTTPKEGKGRKVGKVVFIN
ncbi:hypothetical protein SAMN05216474_2629 [Lishizhenia tianjinensis]|uniref:PorZ N-terminal beta-propeller domain-containing protein n=1 Tax=Lishizhenia tianjinensis TaxID=477690 RepID=A0A1I7BAU1_9FLAO|nr:hypothetical protein [Lishizhenia tianjinensis]SFT84254.1 hypothetical protein SAMN05216474_2629 [Lishizhenia tianjinensis]